MLTILATLILLTSLANAENVVLIVADDLGYSDISAHGSSIISTPNIDSMVVGGIDVLEYYTAASVCTPSRGSLLTGKYFRRLGLFPGVLDPFSSFGLEQNQTTFAKILQSNKIRTKSIGKWHLGIHNNSHPMDHGFDDYFGVPMSHNQCIIRGINWTGAAVPGDTPYGPCPIFKGREIVSQGSVDFSSIDEWYYLEAESFIKDEGNFFLHINTHHAHVPQYPTDDYVESVQMLDTFVGKILSTIDNETTIILTSDNGATYFYGDKGGTNLPFRCSKGSTWEGGHRVPFIVYNRNLKGTKLKLFMTGLDIFNTILDIYGINSVKNDGMSMWKNIISYNKTSPRDTFFFHSIKIPGPIYSPGAVMAVRHNNFKYHVYESGGNCKNFYDNKCNVDNILSKVEYLYDLSSDPGERYNLAKKKEYKKIVEKMKQLIKNHIASFDEECPNILKPLNHSGFPCASPGCSQYPYCCSTRL